MDVQQIQQLIQQLQDMLAQAQQGGGQPAGGQQTAAPANTQLAPVGSVGAGGNVHQQIQRIDSDGQNARAFAAAGGANGPDSNPATAAPDAGPALTAQAAGGPTPQIGAPSNIQQMLANARAGIPITSPLSALAGNRNRTQGIMGMVRQGVANTMGR